MAVAVATDDHCSAWEGLNKTKGLSEKNAAVFLMILTIAKGAVQ
jgi:hypothetical protein